MPRQFNQVTSPLFDESVKRSILYYTITFSAAGLFVLFCITWITAAEYFKARKALKAVIIPYDGMYVSAITFMHGARKICTFITLEL